MLTLQWHASSAARFLGLCTGLAALGGTAPGQAQDVTPNETLVTLQLTLGDAEFNQERAQFVWVDLTGNLWIGNVDRASGRFIPPSGKAELVDPNAMSLVDLKYTYNGPEWLASAGGDQIAYTKFVPGAPRSAETAQIAVARRNADSTWASRTVLPPGRLAPYTSDEPNDPAPRITYVDAHGAHYWCEVDNAASTEAPVIGLPPSPKSVRLTRGERSLVFSTPVDGVSQVFRMKLDGRPPEQLTFDAVDKDLSTVPWMWRAPEYGNELVFMTVAGLRELRVYRADAGGAWQPAVVHTLPEGARIASPETFVFGGRTYIFMTVATAPDNYPSAIWLANLDAAAPRLQPISSPTPKRARIDPEVFITDFGPMIYYNRFNPNINPDNPYCVLCVEGVYRAFTGLKLAAAAAP